MSAPLQSQETAGFRILGAAAFFGLAFWFGSIAARILRQHYGGPFFGSFGFNFNFGLLRFGEPWGSWFVLLCCASFLWAGCSLARRAGRLRIGAFVGAVVLLLLVAGFLAGSL